MNSVKELIKTVKKLRSPRGCPWDKEQTHKSLKRYLIEEAYETIDAINQNNKKALMEELGDVLLQVVLHAQIASENKDFNIYDVANHINKKMISRHPHVFSNVKLKTSAEVLVNWEKLKEKEKPDRKNTFDGIPTSLPALLKAWKISKKAAKVGFDWKKEVDLWKTFEKELIEFKLAIKKQSKSRQEEELGDLLFMIANIARWYKIDPEDILNSGINKFIKRFNKVRKMLNGKDFTDISANALNNLWEKVKKKTK